MALSATGRDVHRTVNAPITDMLEKRMADVGYYIDRACSECGGIGHVKWTLSRCEACNGQGHIPGYESIRLTIQPERMDGTRYQTVRGHEGIDGKHRGDLTLTVIGKLPDTVETPEGVLVPFFKASGSNLLASVHISPAEAHFGGEIYLPTLNGAIRHPLKAGIKDGHRLKITLAGLYQRGKKKRGDIICTIRVAQGSQHKRLISENASLKTTLGQIKKQLNTKPVDMPPPDATQFPEGSVPDLVNSILPAIDSLENAVAAMDSPTDAAHRQGLEMILKMKREALAAHDVLVIPSLGKAFNPHVHHAIAMDSDTGMEKGLVNKVVQNGYTYAGRLIRPALVHVTG